MLDILIPTKSDSVDLLGDCLVSIRENTIDIPYSIRVCLGGVSDDIAISAKKVVACSVEWSMERVMFEATYSELLFESISMMRNDWVAVIPPDVRINDNRWFGKMQSPFMKDPHTMFVDALPNTPSSTVPPARRDRKTIDPSARVFLSKRNILSVIDKHAGLSLEALEKSALAIGGNVWTAAGVRFHEVECPESSEETNPYESSSSMTED